MAKIKALFYSILKMDVINKPLGLVFHLFYRLGWVRNFVFPYKGDLKIRMNKAQFLMRSDGSDSVASKLYVQRAIAFEPEVFRVFEAIAQRAKGFVDVGAHSGAYSLYVKSLNPACRVWSFEPVPFIFEVLTRNQELNGFADMSCYPLGLSDKSGRLTFYVPNSIRLPTAGSLRGEHRRGASKIEVKVSRLDDIVESEGIDHIDLIKIDTESTEPAVLEGGLKSIQKFRPLMLVEVLKEKEGRSIESLLHDMNYNFFQILSTGLRRVEKLSLGEWPSHWNFLFVPEEKMAEMNAESRFKFL